MVFIASEIPLEETNRTFATAHRLVMAAERGVRAVLLFSAQRCSPIRLWCRSWLELSSRVLLDKVPVKFCPEVGAVVCTMGSSVLRQPLWKYIQVPEGKL